MLPGFSMKLIVCVLLALGAACSATAGLPAQYDGWWSCDFAKGGNWFSFTVRSNRVLSVSYEVQIAIDGSGRADGLVGVITKSDFKCDAEIRGASAQVSNFSRNSPAMLSKVAINFSSATTATVLFHPGNEYKGADLSFKAIKGTDGSGRTISQLFGKPPNLLPGDTCSSNLHVRVRLRNASRPDLLRAEAPTTSYHLGSIIIPGPQDEQFSYSLWTQGAIHEITEPLAYGGHIFEPAGGNSLVFQVDFTKGYIFLDGRGVITLPDGKRVGIGPTARGAVLGRPVTPVEPKAERPAGSKPRKRTHWRPF